MVPRDGLPARPSGIWVRDKLGILHNYLRAFATVCNRPGDFYFVDAMAGPGLCELRERPETLRGSTLIALNVRPPFTLCLSVENDHKNFLLLKARTEQFGSRAAVFEGNCNEELVNLMSQYIPPLRPCFCLLDPEGTELEWSTLRGLANRGNRGKKPELLVLFASGSLTRMFPTDGPIEPHNERRLALLFPPGADWQRIWLKRRADAITPSDARDSYVELYRRGIQEELGYEYVISREVRKTNGALLYHLVFATDNPVGCRIMEYVFRTMYSNRTQLPLLL